MRTKLNGNQFLGAAPARGAWWFAVATILSGLCAMTTPVQAQAGARQRCVRAFESAQEHERDGELIEAQDLFQDCTQRQCGRRLMRECRRQLGQLRRDLPTVLLAFSASGPEEVQGVRVEMDGQPLVDELDGRPVTINPGFHTFAFKLSDGRQLKKMQTVRRGDKELPVIVEEQKRTDEPVEVASTAALTPAVDWQASDEEAASPGSIAPYVVGGVSVVAGVGAFVALRLMANAKYAELPECYPGCSAAQVDEVRALYTASNISLMAAGAGTAVAALMWWLGQDDEVDPNSRSPRPFLVPTADGAMAGVGAKF